MADAPSRKATNAATRFAEKSTVTGVRGFKYGATNIHTPARVKQYSAPPRGRYCRRNRRERRQSRMTVSSRQVDLVPKAQPFRTDIAEGHAHRAIVIVGCLEPYRFRFEIACRACAGKVAKGRGMW